MLKFQLILRENARLRGKLVLRCTELNATWAIVDAPPN